MDSNPAAPPPNMMLQPGAGAAPSPTQFGPEDISKAYQHTALANAAIREVLMKPKPTRDDVFELASTLVNEGVMTAQQAAKELADMPRAQTMLKPWLFLRWHQTEQHLEQLGEMLAPQQPMQGMPPGMPPRMAAGPEGGMPMPQGGESAADPLLAR